MKEKELTERKENKCMLLLPQARCLHVTALEFYFFIGLFYSRSVREQVLLEIVPPPCLFSPSHSLHFTSLNSGCLGDLSFLQLLFLVSLGWFLGKDVARATGGRQREKSDLRSVRSILDHSPLHKELGHPVEDNVPNAPLDQGL